MSDGRTDATAEAGRDRDPMTAVPEPLRLGFEVSCSVDHAFRAWTERFAAWWPRGHGISADGEIVFQRGVGGRIYEVDEQGVEHDWGRVTAWEPPHRVAFVWHLHRPVELGSEVELSFAAADGGLTHIELVQGGWERFGDDASTWRARNLAGWGAVIPHFEAYLRQLDPFATSRSGDPI